VYVGIWAKLHLLLPSILDGSRWPTAQWPLVTNYIYTGVLSKIIGFFLLRSAQFGEKKLSGVWVAERQYLVLNQYLLNRQKQRGKNINNICNIIQGVLTKTWLGIMAFVLQI
jgi:hypothetical protein